MAATIKFTDATVQSKRTESIIDLEDEEHEIVCKIEENSEENGDRERLATIYQEYKALGVTVEDALTL